MGGLNLQQHVEIIGPPLFIEIISNESLYSNYICYLFLGIKMTLLQKFMLRKIECSIIPNYSGVLFPKWYIIQICMIRKVGFSYFDIANIRRSSTLKFRLPLFFILVLAK